MKFDLVLLLKLSLTSRNSVSRSPLSLPPPLLERHLHYFFVPLSFTFSDTCSHTLISSSSFQELFLFTPFGAAQQEGLWVKIVCCFSQNIFSFLLFARAQAYHSVKKSLLGRKREDHVHDAREKHLGVAVHVFRLRDKDNPLSSSSRFRNQSSAPRQDNDFPR